MVSPREVNTIEERFQFLHILGRTQGELVLLVNDVQTSRQQRLMVLTADWAREPSVREALLARWQALMDLRHPNVLQVVSAGVTRQDYPLSQSLPRIRRGAPYMVTEVCHGRDLTTWLGTGPLHAGFVTEVCEQAGAALAAGAAQGFYHLSLHPERIFCHVDEEISDKLPKVKVIDLGLAPVVRGELQHIPWLMAMRAGIVYMAPELLAAEAELPATLAACDQYALAAVTYQLISGRPPFGLTGEADEGIKSFIREIQRTPVLPLPSACGAEVSAVLLRALSKRPEHRYPSIAEFTVAMREALSRPKMRPVRGGGSTLTWTFVIAGGLFAALTATPFLLMNSNHEHNGAPPDLGRPTPPAFDLRPPPLPDLHEAASMKLTAADMASRDMLTAPPPIDLAHGEVSSPDLAVAPPPPQVEPVRPPQDPQQQALRCGSGQIGVAFHMPEASSNDQPTSPQELTAELRACIGKLNIPRKHFPIGLVAPRRDEYKVFRSSQELMDESLKLAINRCVTKSIAAAKPPDEGGDRIHENGMQLWLRCVQR